MARRVLSQPGAPGRPDARLAAAGYAAVAVFVTWPLVLHLQQWTPADLGDALLNRWILAWDVDRLTRLLGGDVSALATFWHANIFHPEPYALGFSETLLAQAVQVLPFALLTGDVSVGYNLVFISTYALSGLGAFLLVRDLTGHAAAAWLAGLAYACLPFRIEHDSHLQVLSSQWMPFALYGFRRYFESGRVRALAGGAAALVAQNLSCGYYLVYFSVFVPPFVLYEMHRRGLLRDRRTWTHLAVAAAGVAAVTLIAAHPTIALRSTLSLKRSRAEVLSFSADVLAYATTAESSLVWGRILRTHVVPEGSLFPGLLTAILATVGVRSAWRTRALRPLPGTLFYAGALFAAVWLSFGPRIRAAGYRIVDAGIYGVLYPAFPGFDSLRVPARYGMIAGLFLAVVAGLGVAALAQRRWWRPWFVLPFSAIVIAEGLSVPFRMTELPQPPGIYSAMTSLPGDAVVLELPFGDIATELRYTYFSRLHRRRLVNGYSGFFPKSFALHLQRFSKPWTQPEQSWAMVRQVGVTHVVLHERGYPPEDAPKVLAWLDDHGATLVSANGSDTIYRVPSAARVARGEPAVP